MGWAPPSAADFKTFFARDFNFAKDDEQTNTDKVLNADIARAVAEAGIHFNSGIYGSNAGATSAYMYLAAFSLVRNLQNSAAGIASAARFPISAKSAGPVNVTYQVPERYLKDPYIAALTANGYGMRYLELSLPMAQGNVAAVQQGNIKTG